MTVIKYMSLFLMVLAAGTAVLCFMTNNIGLGVFNIFLIGTNFWIYKMNREMEKDR